jgi:hypothetical protein
LQGVVFFQTQLPELLKDARFGPLLKATMSGAAGADAGGVQRVPLAAGAQSKQDGVHGLAVVHARVVAPQGVRLGRREQGGDLGPQFIGDLPISGVVLGFHLVFSWGTAGVPQELYPLLAVSYRDRL